MMTGREWGVRVPQGLTQGLERGPEIGDRGDLRAALQAELAEGNLQPWHLHFEQG